jgi:hypothetical protein
MTPIGSTKSSMTGTGCRCLSDDVVRVRFRIVPGRRASGGLRLEDRYCARARGRKRCRSRNLGRQARELPRRSHCGRPQLRNLRGRPRLKSLRGRPRLRNLRGRPRLKSRRGRPRLRSRHGWPRLRSRRRRPRLRRRWGRRRSGLHSDRLQKRRWSLSRNILNTGRGYRSLGGWNSPRGLRDDLGGR